MSWSCNYYRYTHKSVAPALAGLSVRDDDRLFDVTVHGKVISEGLVGGVVRQSADEQLGPRGVFLLATTAATATSAGHGGQAGQAADQTFGRTQQASVWIGHCARHQHDDRRQ